MDTARSAAHWRDDDAGARRDPDVIDRCQNHVLAGSRVRRHYLKHDYADEAKQLGRSSAQPLRPRMVQIIG